VPLERRKRLVTIPPATSVWLRLLLKSAEIKELRRGGADHAECHRPRDRYRNQRTALGEDAQLFQFVRHALGPHERRTCLDAA
jgi:hypothetical protein